MTTPTKRRPNANHEWPVGLGPRKLTCTSCHEAKTMDYFTLSGENASRSHFVCNSCRISTNHKGVFEASMEISWQDKAACTPKNSGLSLASLDVLFFPKEAKEVRAEAWKGLCQFCPVAKECADFGERSYSEGVWGGNLRLSEDRKKKQNAPRVRDQSPVCQKGHDRLEPGAVDRQGRCKACQAARYRRNYVPKKPELITECRNGHEMDETQHYYYVSGQRKLCRACALAQKAQRQREYQARKKKVCRNGHDLSALNSKYENGRCKSCQLAYQLKNRPPVVPTLTTRCANGHDMPENERYYYSTGRMRQCNDCLKNRNRVNHVR